MFMYKSGTILTFIFIIGCSSPSARRTASSQESTFTYTPSYNCAGSEDPSVWSALAGFKVGPSFRSIFKSPDEKILRPFSADGCSLSPDGVPHEKAEAAWTQCCVSHDTVYWVGGTLEEKNSADQDLEKCIAEKGYPKIAHLYNLSVGQFGGPESSQDFRWGYGWNYRRPYAPLTDEEKKQVQILYGGNLEKTQKDLRENFKNLKVSCSTEDKALKGFNKEEKWIYSYLNRKLKKDDTVQWARRFSHEEIQEYLLKFEGCSTPVAFMFSAKSKTLIGVRSSCEEL
nr:hypothetical protein [uncultured Bdellovibrio sp.]